jgi:glycosyltransferase involved in cell wall biosynthesis
MRIFIIKKILLPAGGSERESISLAKHLNNSGHKVFYFIESPVEKDNQYLLALQKNGIPIFHPKSLELFLVTWLDPQNFIPLIFFLPRFFITLIDMRIKKRTFFRSWIGVWGKLRSYLPSWRESLLQQFLYFSLMKQKKYNPDIVLNFNTKTGIVWATRQKIPNIYREGHLPGSLGLDWWDLVKPEINKVDLIWTNSEAAVNEVRKYLDYKGPIKTIPNLMDLDFASIETPINNNFKSGVVIGTAGRLTSDKGHEWLIRSVPKILESVNSIKIKVLVAGDGIEKNYLINLVHTLQIEPQVKFLGNCDTIQMDNFWHQIDFFVLPSLMEGISGAAIEAMAYGKPVISTSVGGMAELIENNYSGLLVPPCDSLALAEAILYLIHHEEQSRRIGSNGRSIVEKRYDKNVILPQIIDLFTTVINIKSGLV